MKRRIFWVKFFYCASTKLLRLFSSNLRAMFIFSTHFLIFLIHIRVCLNVKKNFKTCRKCGIALGLRMSKLGSDGDLDIPRSRWPDRSDPWSDEFRAHTCSRCARITWSGKGFERTFVWTMVWNLPDQRPLFWDGLVRGSFKPTLV